MTISRNKGFTLVEMIVSLGIFAVVALVAVTALLKIVDANKKAQTIASAMTNINFALDTMSRELRVGSSVQCISGNFGNFNPAQLSGGTIPCSGVTSAPVLLVFKSSNLDTVSSPPCQLIYAYLFTNQDPNYPVPVGSPPGPPDQLMLEKAEQQPGSNCSSNFRAPTTGGGSPGQPVFEPIVSPNNVSLSSFYLNVSYNSSSQPFPLILAGISGTAGTIGVTQTYFQMQTAASPRVP